MTLEDLVPISLSIKHKISHPMDAFKNLRLKMFSEMGTCSVSFFFLIIMSLNKMKYEKMIIIRSYDIFLPQVYTPLLFLVDFISREGRLLISVNSSELQTY